MKRPQLLVEALGARNDSGLGKLVRMFVHGLNSLADKADIHVVLPKAAGFDPGAHCRTIEVNPAPMRVWTETAFPWLIRKTKPDAVLCLGWTLPRWRPTSRYGLLIADVGPLENMGITMSSRDQNNADWLRRMPGKADLLLTISETTKSRMTSLLGIQAGKIQVVRPIHRSWFSGESATRAGRYPEGDYFLALGNVEPRKNFPGLIKAYAALRSRHADAPPLYIVGHRAWGFQAAESMAIKLGVAEKVIFTGYLSEVDRHAHLAHCMVFISSSLYEGWGLPLFEALSLGKPAIYQRGTSQDEFALNMALATDCANPSLLAESMERLWSNTAEREKYQAALKSGFPAILDYDLETELSKAINPLLMGAI